MAYPAVYPFVPLEVERIELANGLWWEIKRRLTFGDELAIQSALLRFTVDGQGDLRADMRTEIEFGRYLLRRLAIVSVAWNVPDGIGGVAPLTEETIAALDSEFLAPVLARVEEMHGQAFAAGLAQKKS